MLKKTINKFNNIPTLGLGCMRLPKIDENGAIDEVEAFKMFDIAYERGIRYFDTAYPYHGGKSEEFVGRALKKFPRESFYIATKMPIWECKNIEDVKTIFFKQLKNLQVDYFDFYLCHAMNIDRHNTYIELGAYTFLEQMKKEGLIRNLGFSFHDAPNNLAIIADYLPWDFAQIQLNYLDWTLQGANIQYEILESRNIACVVMEPVRGGALANVTKEAYDIFKGARPKASIASWALRYVASKPNVLVVLSGMSNTVQLEDNINTFTNFEYLTKAEEELVEKAKKAILGNKFIPCTGCRYCLPCPFGVNIPQIFSIYNQYQIDKNFESFKTKYTKLSEEKLNDCRHCRVCRNKCPQHILIDEEIEKINQEYAESRK